MASALATGFTPDVYTAACAHPPSLMELGLAAGDSAIGMHLLQLPVPLGHRLLAHRKRFTLGHIGRLSGRAPLPLLRVDLKQLDEYRLDIPPRQRRCLQGSLFALRQVEIQFRKGDIAY